MLIILVYYLRLVILANKTDVKNYHSYFLKSVRVENKQEKQAINDGNAQIVVVLTIKEMSYLVVDLFDDLEHPLSYL